MMRARRVQMRIIDSLVLAERFWKACQKLAQRKEKADMAESEYIETRETLME